MNEFMFDLRLHDEGGTAAGAAPQNGGETTAAISTGAEAQSKRASKNPLANVRYGKQETEVETTNETAAIQTKAKAQNLVTTDEDARRAEFERLIKTDYKDLFDERAQKIINDRFKTTKQLEEQATKLKPLLETIAAKYGVDSDDVDALSKAIDDDESYYEEEAYERGMTVQQLKQVKQLERENAQLRAKQENEQRQRAANEQLRKWSEEAEKAKEVYPNFDLNKEAQNDQFIRMLQAGINVRNAYEIIHRDEIMSGALQYTAQQIQQKTVNDIRARGMRPRENGLASGPAAETRPDVTKWTKADREEISRRVRNGEKIRL